MSRLALLAAALLGAQHTCAAPGDNDDGGSSSGDDDAFCDMCGASAEPVLRRGQGGMSR